MDILSDMKKNKIIKEKTTHLNNGRIFKWHIPATIKYYLWQHNFSGRNSLFITQHVLSIQSLLKPAQMQSILLLNIHINFFIYVRSKVSIY